VARFLHDGAAQDVQRFDLDVSASNEAAIRLYESFGFRVEAARTRAGMRYHRMVLREADLD
jgi:ribosomal protein S18 acetylase RimI-like enzyme